MQRHRREAGVMRYVLPAASVVLLLAVCWLVATAVLAFRV